MRFYADREEGLVWCERCVPAEVGLLARERTTATGRKRHLSRYVVVERKRFMTGTLSVPARCSSCGAVAPVERS